MDPIRKKLAAAHFGDEAQAPSPIITIIIQIIQMLLTGGVCPTPAAALAAAKRRPRIAYLKSYYYALQITDDGDQAAHIAGTIGKVLPDATDAEANEIAASS